MKERLPFLKQRSKKLSSLSASASADRATSHLQQLSALFSKKELLSAACHMDAQDTIYGSVRTVFHRRADIPCRALQRREA
jgi:hypothetical protein